MRRHQDDTLAV